MYPQAVAIQAQCIVGLLVALIVDGKGREVSEIHSLLVRQAGQFHVRGLGRQAQPHWVGVDGAIPVAQLEQEFMGSLGRLGTPQVAEELAPGDTLQSQILDFPQMIAIFREDLAGAHTFQESCPDSCLICTGLARRPLLFHLISGAGLYFVGSAAEVESILHQLPGLPGRGRGKAAIG